VALPVRNGGSRHTGQAAPPHKNIQQTLKMVIEDGIHFICDSFKSVSRNIEKLLTVMEYVLGNDHAFITSNYLISNGHIERRPKLLKPGHDIEDSKRNWSDSTGLAKNHMEWLKLAAKTSHAEG